MDVHGIFYVYKAQMIEKIPSDDEHGSEPMQSSTDTNEKDVTETQDGSAEDDMTEVHIWLSPRVLINFLYIMRKCQTEVLKKIASEKLSLY